MAGCLLLQQARSDIGDWLISAQNRGGMTIDVNVAITYDCPAVRHNTLVSGSSASVATRKTASKLGGICCRKVTILTI